LKKQPLRACKVLISSSGYLAIMMHLLFAFPKQIKPMPGDGKKINKMKNILTNLMMSAVLLFGIGSGLKAQEMQLRAAVPFAWQLNGHQMKAGEYVISRDASMRLMRIEGLADHTGSFLVVIPAADRNRAARLVFHRYGNQYFLAEVVAPGNKATLPVSRSEKLAMESEQPRELATVFDDVRQALK
jgi:hypothetical protein